MGDTALQLSHVFYMVQDDRMTTSTETKEKTSKERIYSGLIAGKCRASEPRQPWEEEKNTGRKGRGSRDTESNRTDKTKQQAKT